MINATATATNPGSALSIPASSVTVTGCGTDDCTYTIKQGASIVGGPTTYSSGYDLVFTGSTETGKRIYEVHITHDNKSKKCGGTYEVTYTGSSSSSSSVAGSSSSTTAGAQEIEIKQNTVLKKGKTYKITGCDQGGSRIQMNNIGFKNCVDVFGTGGTYWYNNDNDCGGEIFVTYPVTVTIPNTADLTIGGCGN